MVGGEIVYTRVYVDEQTGLYHLPAFEGHVQPVCHANDEDRAPTGTHAPSEAELREFEAKFGSERICGNIYAINIRPAEEQHEPGFVERAIDEIVNAFVEGVALVFGLKPGKSSSHIAHR